MCQHRSSTSPASIAPSTFRHSRLLIDWFTSKSTFSVKSLGKLVELTAVIFATAILLAAGVGAGTSARVN